MMGSGPFQPTRTTNVEVSAEPSKSHSFSRKKALREEGEGAIKVMLNKIHLEKVSPLLNLPNSLACFLLLSP